jgi:hypothetical protein
MARDLKVQATITAKDQTGAAVKSAQSGFARLGGFIKDRFVITLGDVVRAGRAIINGFQAVIGAAQEQERAIRSLDAALSPLGASAGKVRDALVEQAEALQKSTGFSDEAIESGQALAAQFTQNEAKLKAITVAAVNLAASGRTDLQSAFLLLGKASAGATETLGRFGVKIDESVPKAERFGKALEILNNQVGGLAVAQVGTFAGALRLLDTAFGELLEKLGDAVVKNDAFRAALASVSTLMRDPGFLGAIEAVASGIARIVTAFSNLVQGNFAAVFGTLEENMRGVAALGAQIGNQGLGSAAVDEFAEATNRLKVEHGAAAVAAEKRAAVESTLAAIIAKERAETEKLNAAAKAARDVTERNNELLAERNRLVQEGTAFEESRSDSIRESTEALEENTGATERNAEAQAVSQSTNPAGEGFRSFVTGRESAITEVSRRSRTAADTPAALLRRNIEALRASALSPGPGVIQRLQRQLAQLESADFGTIDETRSLA